MANSSITINFVIVPAAGTYLQITETSLNISLFENMVTNRLGSGQVTVPEFIPASGPDPDMYDGYISENYKNAFNLDHNATGLFTVVSTNGPDDTGLGTVVITANYPNANFVINGSTVGATITTDNIVASPDFTISNIEFTEADDNQATKSKLTVTTNELATKITAPFALNDNTENPFEFDWLRGQTISITVENENGDVATQSVTMPSILSAANFDYTVNNSPNGATLIITETNPTTGLTLQYSLDGIVWQSSNVFTGLLVGAYAVYVKDQLGAEVTKSITINENGIYESYFYISKSNSLRFAKRISFGISDNYKNDENTLSCEVDAKIPYKEVQHFQTADVITTQFKSNYGNNSAKVIQSDGTEVDIPVNKMTANIGMKDKRDAIKYNLGDGKTGIYFLAGNNYNYDTNAVTAPYVLNGALPEWAQIGNYIQLGVAWFLIEEVIYDEVKSAEVVVLSNNYTGTDTSVIVGSIYNRFNYEVYEFTVDMGDYPDEYFRVRINATDDNFTEIIHLSEQIWSKEKHDRVLEIRYWNDTNTDVFYATGITHLIRMSYYKINGKIDEDSEAYKTDTSAILLSADLFEEDDIIFEPMTKEMWRKLTQALSHKNVFINEVGYIKNGNFNTEGPLEDSNLYVLTATMLKTGNVYRTHGIGSSLSEGSTMEVPGLIATDDLGFLSY